MQRLSDLYREGGYDEAALPLVGGTWASGGSNTYPRSLDFQNLATLTAGAGAWQTIADVQGAGMLRGLGMYCGSIGAAPAYIELRVTIDGVEQSRALIGPNAGYVGLPAVAGVGDSSGLTSSTWAFRFSESLRIEARRSAAQSATVYWTHSLDRRQ